MADYQLLGDTFGYHAGYPANPSQQNPALASSQSGGSQPGLGMLPSVPPGQQPYHPLQGQPPRPGYPQASDPLMSHKMHQSYPGYHPPTAPGASPAIRSQYSQNYMPHASMDSYSSLAMSQSHMPPSGQSIGAAYGQHQNMMGQYPGQRLHSPSPLHTAPRHPSMPSQYASSYGSSSQNSSSYHSGSSSELWSSGQSMAHLQQTPFSAFPSSAAAGSSNSGSTSGSGLHSSRTSQFGSNSDYAANSSNPYFASHMSSESSYPPGYSGVPSTQSQQSSNSRSSTSSSRSQQYNSQIGPYSTTPSASSIPAQASQPSAANSASSNSSAARFSHYSSYPQNMPFDPSSQARLSPYPTPTPPSGSQTPNSPQYRSSSGYPQSGSTPASQLPVHSPRRPTATPPAGSPMPPTSHTPGPPSVGSNSTQGSSQGSAFSIAAPSSGHHMPNSASSVPPTPSSLQQLEQMVMPHLSSGSSNNSATTSKTTSSANSSSAFFPANSNTSPMSPQSQSQSKLFPHFASSSPQNSQFPYHQYPQQTQQTPNSVQWQSPSAANSQQLNTHSMKASPMMQQPLVHGAQHMSSSSTNASSKPHQASDSSLHQPYGSYGSSTKTNNEMNTPESTDYSQSFTSPSSLSSSASSMPVSHTISQSGYNNIPNSSLPPSGGLSYDTLSNQNKQQTSLKNDTQQFDPSKNSRSIHDPMTGPQSQMSSLNSNSYHSIMPQSYPNQPMPGYPNQSSRFDQPHPMSNQYGMSELSSSSYSAEHDSSMIYDPYNIDNALGIAPHHQTMSEYRESQANLQQSGNADYAQNDPYAANFDDFETTSKRKGKGRPKKESGTAVKKERKPRAPRTPSARSAGRGRGRANKTAVVDRVPLPNIISDYGDPTPPYGGAVMGTPGADGMDMYNNSVDMYSANSSITNKIVPQSTPASQMTSGLINNAQVNLNSSVLPQTADLMPQYGSHSQQPISQLPGQHVNNSIPPPPMPPPTGQTQPQQSSFSPLPDPTYPSFVPEALPNDQPATTIPNSSLICDKDILNDTKSMPSSYNDRFLVEPPVSNDTPPNNSAKSEPSTVPEIPQTIAPLSDDVDMGGEVEKPISQMSFNSTMDKSCLPNSQTPTGPMYPKDSSSFSASSTDKGLQENQDINDLQESASNFESSVSIIGTQQSQLTNVAEFNSSKNFSEEENLQLNFASSTPIVTEKKKKSKKRKSKKDETLTTETDDISIANDEPKPKSKKKRSKKQKAIEEDLNLSLDNTITSAVDFDEKTQLSIPNLEASTVSIPNEADTPKPAKSRSKSKKKKAVPKEVDAEIPLNEAEASAVGAEVNGDVNVAEIVEEKPKKPKVKNKSPKKKLPKLALKLKQNKKRRRGFGSPDNSDLEKTPPPSPSPEDESAQHKRRSARNTKRQRYNDDIDLDLSDDEFLQKSADDNQAVNAQLLEDTMVVEKILANRMAKREIEVEPNDKKDETEENKDEPVFIEVEEFYVKYKNLSYLHCDWKTEDELEKGDRRISQKIKRYRQKKDVNVFDFLDEEPFNPDYVEVDRVLDVNEVVEEVYEDEEELSKVPVEDIPEIKNESEIIKTTPEETASEEPIIDKPEKMDVDITTDENDAQSNITEGTEIKKEIKAEADDESNATVVTDTKVEENQKSINEMDTDVKESEEKISKTSEEKNDISEIKDSLSPSNADITKTNDKDLQEESKPIKERKKTTRIVRHFLVKWRGLSYEESTWELEDDIDQGKIQQFWKFRNPPPKSEWKIKKRPKTSEWNKREFSPVYKNGNTLREYQLEGVNWLSFCWHNGQNCILADEMGLGKTIQSITFVQEMVWYGIPYPYLIIVPLSTIGNWQREFETWTDLNVVTYHGSSASRNMLQEYELYYKNEKNERIQNIYKFQVMITTFEVILTDCLELSSIKWIACIIDEAHRLKNRNCKLLEGLRMMAIEHRVLLTGTPLQNNVEELFSLLHFLEPSQFTSNEHFMSEFGDLKTEAQVDKLKAILKPMMLRRLKEDVEKSLAPKEETIIEVELTNVQKKYYRAILERNFQFLSKGGTYANMPNLMNTVMELRKCCIHPFLINGAEEQILQEFRQQHNDESTLSAIIQSSGKLVLIDKLLPRLKENGHRVLIFSQMVRCLDILEDYLCQRRYPFERIDGRVRGNLRQAAIDRFSKPDSDRFVFLLCTRAGGLGINLTAADTVIIFDSDWNPQNDLQAQARCHRIGQKKSVKVYRLICRSTYEREMFDRASLKLGLDKAVLQSINAQKNLPDNQLSKKEIEDLLRKGAYGALMDDDNAGDKFCEEDIDMILQRRTTKIIIESEGKGSTFSKASFATSDNRTDIEIDDPNFWEKWAKKANFDVDELKNRNELIVQEPRRRTQTKRFGADDAVLDISELDTSTDEEETVSMRTRGSRNRVSKKKRKGRNYDPEHDEDYAQEIGFGWSRSEFFKVEKSLLTFGWNRWDECAILANFKRNLTKQDVEDISRVILLFALQNYKGDEKVKSFILELITPPSEKSSTSEAENSKSNLQDESNVEVKCKRSKKNKAATKSVNEEIENLDWAKNEKYNPDILLVDETYRKHLLRHANKILLRVRLLSYIKNEIVGDLHEKVFNCLHIKDIPMAYCQPDGEPPATWWNEEADKSLLIGVYKHGYDRYNLMRQDPALCFLARCGPPDGAALLAEMTSEDDLGKTLEDDEEPETPSTPSTPQVEANQKEDKPKDDEISKDSQKEEKVPEQNYLPFPTASEMNNRLRRLVTCYQRNFKKEEARIAQKARHLQRLERLEKFEAAIRERENKKREQAQKKWSRREESDFYRVVSSFGVEYDKKTDVYDWTRFRMYAKLERKLDDTLTEYYKAFYAMCKKVVGRRLTEDEENLPISVDPITEERANRTLARIELLFKIRDDILCHPELDDRLKLCQPQLDLPEWWICGKHDKDLLIGAAKYGLNRLDYNLMNDPELSFIEVVRNFESLNTIDEKKFCNEEIENEVKNILNIIIDQIEKDCQLVPQSTISENIEQNQEDKMETNESVDNVNDPANANIDKASEDLVNQTKSDNLQNCENKETDKNETNEDKQPNETKDFVKVIDNDSFNITPMVQPKPSLKWPRDRVLQIRLENVCLAIEKNEWPTFRSINAVCLPHSTTPSVATADSSPRPSTPCSLSSASQEHTPHPTPDHTPRRESQSPFTGDFFYSGTNNPPQPINNNLINNMEDGTRRRRRRRRRFEMENDRTKLHSLLNAQYEPQQQSQQANIHNQPSNSKNIKPPVPPTSTPLSTTALASSLFKNSKASSILNSIPSQFLSPLLTGLPFNIRSALRDELLNDEKASLLFGNTLQSTLAAAAVANASKTATSSASSSKSMNLDTKSNVQSAPPPAHQSSTTRNSLSLGTLDLTSKFKSAANVAMEKSSATTSRRSNLPYPAHKQAGKNASPEKADVLDLSSVPTKPSSKASSMSNLLSQTLKKSLDASQSFANQTNKSVTITPTNTKKKSKIGSRIDALALNLQAKKMMEEVKQVDTTTTLANKLAASSSNQPSLPKNLFNEKDLYAAFSNFGDKRQSSVFFEELSKQSALFKSAKSNKSATTAPTPSTSSMFKKSTNDPNKTYLNLMDSLKLLTNKSTDKTVLSDKVNQLKQNLKTMVEEHPELLAQNPAFASLLTNPLFAQSLNLGSSMGSSSSSASTVPDKAKPTRSNKRTRSQYELPSPTTSKDEPLSKRPMLNASQKAALMDPKNTSLKYLSTLLDKNAEVESKIKSMIKEKAGTFKTPSSVASSHGTSSIRTRTSDKRSSQSANNSASNSSTNFPNMNASNLLNNLSLAAAAAATGSGSSKQQQTAASLLANSYANAFMAANSGKSNSSSNYPNAAGSFANFGFNNNMLSSLPSMKMFLDAAAAAAASVSKNSSTSTNSSSSTTTVTNTSATSTSTTPSLSSFANIFGNLSGMNNLTNPLFNFSNFANLAALNQSGNKKDSNSAVDFAALANNIAAASSSSHSSSKNNEDKSKSSKSFSNSSGSSNKNKNNLSQSAAANMLSSSGLGSSALPFLYSNSNFPMSSLYNPLSLGSFGLASPFLNNPNLMNGLANFSNVFTSTTSTATSSTNQSLKSKPSNTSGRSSSSRQASNKSSTSTSSTPSGLSLASGLLASSTGANAASASAASTIDSDDESLKSLMANDDDDEINGEFDADSVHSKKPDKNACKKSKSNRMPIKDSKSKRSAATSRQ